MIRAIIFDCFGVLTTDGWLPFKRRHLGHDPDQLQQATDLNKQTDSGLLDYRTYLERIAAMARVTVHAVQSALEENVANDQLLQYIASELKPHYKIGMLSNAANDWREQLFGKERAPLFDAVALSYETGHTKPSEQAYLTIADRLGLSPEECVFVDDQERYCTGARDVGMQAVYYQHFDQFKTDIESILQGNGKA